MTPPTTALIPAFVVHGRGGSDARRSLHCPGRRLWLWLCSVGMVHRTIQTIFTALVSFAVTGCVSGPRPSVRLCIEGANQVTIPYTDAYGVLRYEGHPTIEVSINSVTGRFIIDTGATVPILNMTAVRRCGIQLSSEPAKTEDFWGDKVGMKLATNITVRLAPNFTVHWPKVLVHPGDDAYFGILDYGTLKAGHAVMDMKQKTITITR